MSPAKRVSVAAPLLLIGALGWLGCASGPHPSLAIATKDLGCEEKALKVHEIFPRKVRVEGCGKEAIYVKLCAGYGMDSKCDWQRKLDQ